MPSRIWTISNILSLSRVLLILPLAYCLLADVQNKRTWAALIIVAAALTDFLDGYVARLRHEVSEVGKIIDPLADKLCIGAVALILLWAGDLSLWYVLVVVLRDLLILFGGVYIRRKKKIIAQSNWPGKFAASSVALVLLLSVAQVPNLESLRQFVIWMSVALMAFSLLSYVRRLSMGVNAGKGSLP